MKRIFDDQVYNEYGLYLLRIFQQSNWKSVILDDFIAVKSELVEGIAKDSPLIFYVKGSK